MFFQSALTVNLTFRIFLWWKGKFIWRKCDLAMVFVNFCKKKQHQRKHMLLSLGNTPFTYIIQFLLNFINHRNFCHQWTFCHDQYPAYRLKVGFLKLSKNNRRVFRNMIHNIMPWTNVFMMSIIICFTEYS